MTSKQSDLVEACCELLRQAGPTDGWTTATRPVTTAILRQIRDLLETLPTPAVELGRLGGKIGGPARAAKLSPERRQEIARKAAKARWGKSLDPAPPCTTPDEATFGNFNGPLEQWP